MRQFLKYELKNNWKTFIINYSLVLFSFISLAIFILVNKLDIDYSTFTFILYANILLFVGGSMILGAILFSINLVQCFSVFILPFNPTVDTAAQNEHSGRTW